MFWKKKYTALEPTVSAGRCHCFIRATRIGSEVPKHPTIKFTEWMRRNVALWKVRLHATKTVLGHGARMVNHSAQTWFTSLFQAQWEKKCLCAIRVLHMHKALVFCNALQNNVSRHFGCSASLRRSEEGTKNGNRPELLQDVAHFVPCCRTCKIILSNTITTNIDILTCNHSELSMMLL